MPDGYGLKRDGDKMVTAHRYVYEKEVGQIPLGLELDHKCKNRSCVNPTHLEPVSHAENVRRGAKTKLSPYDVREIRSDLKNGATRKQLARAHGVTSGAIRFIELGQNWSGVYGD